MAPVSCRSPIHAAVALRRRRTSSPAPSRWRRRLKAPRRRWALPVALTLLACCAPGPGLLAACANDTPAPEVSGTLPTRFFSTPEASTTATPTTSAGAPASLGPELAAQRATALAEPKPLPDPSYTENSDLGAANAAYYFIKLYRYGFITGDVVDFKAMSEDACAFCKSTIDNISALHDSGGWANQWRLDVVSVTPYPQVEGKDYIKVEVKTDAGESITFDGAGQSTVSPAGGSALRMIMRYAGAQWRIGGVEVLK